MADVVTDELEIRSIVRRLALLADTAGTEELGDYLALFTEDATWAVRSNSQLPPQERHGRDEIFAAAKARRDEGVQGPGSNRRHVISNNVILFDDADTAQSRSYFQVFDDSASERPYCSAMGEYHDTFVRTADGWKMHRREIVSG